MSQDREREISGRFGRMIREQRLAAGLRQEDLALVTGVGRRFVNELEAGKATCQLGKALRVAESVGVDFPQIDTEQLLDLPEMEDDEDNEDDDGRVRIHEWTQMHSN